MSGARWVEGPLHGFRVGVAVAAALGLLCAAPGADAAEPSRQLEREVRRAEKALGTGDYPEAGELARSLLATGIEEPLLRSRALRVLGSVLFYNSRVPMGAPSPVADPETRARERAEREAALELAERALRDAIITGGDVAQRARETLAELLSQEGRDEELVEILATYDLERGDTPADPVIERARRCLRYRAGLRERSGPDVLAHVRERTRELVSNGSHPERIGTPTPQYTEAARKARIGGPVIFEMLIDEAGEVACVRPLRGLPLGLTEVTLATVAEWRFQPVRSGGGVPEPIFYNSTLTFGIGEPQRSGRDAAPYGTLRDRSMPYDPETEPPVDPSPPPEPSL